MLFTSPSFLFIFLPITFFVFLFIQKYGSLKLSTVWLLLASLVFYLSWEPWSLIPLICSIFINYFLCRWMQSTSHRLQFLILALGISFNIGLLCWYKYFTFIVNNILLLPHHTATESIPLGMSFYTFTQIAFLVDCYKENYKKNDFLNYALFVGYFPHLICGPILSFKDLYPQLTNPKKFHTSLENISLFILYFSIGFFKKLFIADEFGASASQVFDAPNSPFFDPITAFSGLLAYTLQLYFDFSGYSDMAVGVSYLFGLKIPDNFNAPYQAACIIDFWRRWHISLSLFLRNYLYIPLGGNRFYQYRNLLITMTLGGFWHGGSWTFVAWGAYHGILLSINHLIRSYMRVNTPPLYCKSIKTRFTNAFKIICTFTLVSLGWVLFRSPDLHTAHHIYLSLLNITPESVITLKRSFSINVLLLALIWIFFAPDSITIREKFLKCVKENSNRLIICTAFCCALCLTLGLLSLNKIQHFLYSGF